MQLVIGIILGHVLTMIGVWIVGRMRVRRLQRLIEQSATTLNLKDNSFSLDPKWGPCDSSIVVGPVSGSIVASLDSQGGGIFDFRHEPKDATIDFIIHTSSRSNGSVAK